MGTDNAAARQARRATRVRSVDPGHVGNAVREWIGDAGLTPAGVAHRAGVSVSTVYRLLDDSTDPTLGTLREVAFACGRSLDPHTQPLSEPAAAAAVRAKFERGYHADLPDLALWSDRLSRQVPVEAPVPTAEVPGDNAGASLLGTAGDRDDPQDHTEHLLAFALAGGRASAPLLRSDTVLLRGPVNFGRVASAGQASQLSWAVSGLAGLQMPGLFDPTPVPTILWTLDARRIGQLLADANLEVTTRWQRAHVAICVAEPNLFLNSVEHGAVRYASPLQIALDAFSIGGVAASLARSRIEAGIDR